MKAELRYVWFALLLTWSACASCKGGLRVGTPQPGAGSASTPAATGGKVGAAAEGGENSSTSGRSGAATGGNAANPRAGNQVAPRATLGEWVDVTPPALRAAIDAVESSMRYGVQDILVDPARPSDVYAFVCYAGVWRSEDAGLTWRKVSQTKELETGRPWAAAIESNRARDASTPPKLYTMNGYGNPLGIFTSTDWGVTWTQHALQVPEGEDAYSIDVNPYDSQHLLVGFHESRGLIESTDGAQTWKSIRVPADAGVSVYAFFVDTGNAGTTRQTWLSIPQADTSSPTYRTQDAGERWTKVESFGHSHGTCQIFQQGDGVIYAGGLYGSAGNSIYRSTDHGKTWKGVADVLSTTIIGSSKHLYSTNAQAWGPGSAGLHRATRANGTDWQAVTNPPGMTDGAKRALVTTDKEGRQVIVSGHWKAGIWRYVEP